MIYLTFRSVLQYLKTSKAWAVLEHGITILSSLSLFLGILATEHLFDLITETGKSGISYSQVGIALAIVTVITISQQVLRGTDKYVRSYVSYRNVGVYMSELMLKLSRLSAKHFENPSFLDSVDRTKRCIEYENLGYFSSDCLRFYTYYGVFFISISFYFFKLSPLLPLIIFLSFIPAILGQLAQVKVFTKLENENAPLHRQNTYYKKAISSQSYFKESRTLGAFGFFRKLFTDSLLLLTKKTWEVEKKAALVRLILSLMSFIGFALSTLLLFNSTMSGDISIGSFVAVFGALSFIFSMAEEFVSVYMGQASEALGQIESYYRLLDMEELGGEEAELDFSKGILAKGISFAYPESEHRAVKNVSLTISEGETIAIVGENGAGKTTLVRLLIGLYSPVQGSVEIGGLNTSLIHPTSIYKGISGVFQNFIRYKMTLGENVAISNTKESKDHDHIMQVLEDCNFIDKSVELDTMFSTEFDGVDLSGGQWQRIAIARGLYRPHGFIVLDEPTAAIDPIEEERIYRQFRELARNKTTILVTHRLASAKFAHRIVLMDKGEIIDMGSHDELLERKGKYRTMWEAQSTWYLTL